MEDKIELVEILKKYKNEIDLHKRFDYKFDEKTTILTDDEKSELLKKNSIYEKNVRLKELIKHKYNGPLENQELNFWIINSWGGIQNFKLNDTNEQKIKKFAGQLKINKLSAETFSIISSLSKIASFFDPDNFVIYDSRVIFTINWLILNSKPNDLKFFPMPASRNKNLVDFDLSTIINLLYKDEYNNKSSHFHPVNTAYFEFCDLIKDLSKKVYEDATVKPYFLEMLLFTIAIEEILKDFKSNTTIYIKSKSIY